MHFSKRNLFLLTLLFLLGIGGCSTFSSQRTVPALNRPAECLQFFEHLDKKIEEKGVRNAADFPIPGFPYLRANRFLAALGHQLKGEKERDEWVRWMQNLDLEGRRTEIWNLPEDAIRSIPPKKGGEEGRENLFSQTKSCSTKLLEYDRSQKNFAAALAKGTKVPEEYSTFLRVIGLHPLTALPVALSTENVRERFKAWFQEDINRLPVSGRLQTYVPGEGVFLGPDLISRILRDSKGNGLKVPRPEEPDEERLVRALAPVIIQDVAGSFDSMGRLEWQGEEEGINPNRPVVYYYLAHAFLNGMPILQVHYVIWYGAREGRNPPWFERGRLDGLTIRFSLDSQGKLFMVDIMNNCGCYHFFVPDAARVNQVLSPGSASPPFVPQDLPKLGNEERLGLRVNSGWHQVQRLFAFRESSNSIPYQLVPYKVLESLPQGNAAYKSIFNSEGIIPGTKRSERLFLFPMGVPSVGSMRQRGHHAIDFIGRAHFDDPDLFERNFVLR